MNCAFRPHGKFSTHVEGRRMVSEVTGPWNKELVEYWGLHCYHAAKALSDSGPFVGIAIIRNSMLCPADALEALGRVVRHSATKLHCIAHVIVADASVDGRGKSDSAFHRRHELCQRTPSVEGASLFHPTFFVTSTILSKVCR